MAALAGTVVAAGAPASLCAQTTGPQTNAIDDAARIKTMGLNATAGLDILYDDNVYRVDDRVEDPTADLIVTPWVELTYGKPIGRHDLLLRGRVGYDRFISEGQRSKVRIDTEARAVIRFGATCSITPLASYRQQRADYGDLNQQTENLQRFTTFGADLSCERPGFFPVASYRRDMTRNADAFDYADQTSDSFLGGVGYYKPSLGTITAFYERVNSDRKKLGVENRIDSWGVTFKRSVSPLTQIDADVRWLDVESDSDAVGSYDGLGWNVSLSSSIVPRLKLTATTQRGIVNDSLIASGFAVRTRHRIQGEFAISELTSAGLYAEWERRKFRQDAALRPFSITADRNRRFGGTLKRKLSDRAEVALDAQHYVRRTDTSVADFSGTQVTLGAALRF
ncbi:hypothetical protein L288_02705 [Sphingobium quisquiliarum P25]|uniref:Gellan polysaccharide biosynthesis protein GelF n=1 Tax=Sphingobium quisquiliarum P25 TaxID=1329909 RepID=T0H7K1_9SPHN|nr:hypothetical protein [Sphingobium quisquiliarum]EQB12291.1 hypothetical protein L288_02705 [Sphingobium quisquiliarum P25]